MKAFLYYLTGENATKPKWYAGLGVPFKITNDISFAVKVNYKTTATDMLLKQLERHYGKTFYFILQEDAMPRMDSKCASCGLGWTDREVDAINDENALPFTHMGSPLRTSEADTFSAKVYRCKTCPNISCASLLCGDCAKSIKKRGLHANTCHLCIPKRRHG